MIGHASIFRFGLSFPGWPGSYPINQANGTRTQVLNWLVKMEWVSWRDPLQYNNLLVSGLGRARDEVVVLISPAITPATRPLPTLRTLQLQDLSDQLYKSIKFVMLEGSGPYPHDDWEGVIQGSWNVFVSQRVRHMPELAGIEVAFSTTTLDNFKENSGMDNFQLQLFNSRVGDPVPWPRRWQVPPVALRECHI